MRRLKRVEQPESLSDGLISGLQALRRPAELLQIIRDYLGLGLGLGRGRRLPPIVTPQDLKHFLTTRASHVAQTSLYGYMRTRAGMRYPELFHDDGFVGSLNIAKWQIWLACLSDLAVFAGGLLARDVPQEAPRAAAVVRQAVAEILAETGKPADSGPAYEDGAKAVLARIEACDWTAVPDDGGAFTESPPALVRWAPIIDELKQLDEPIVLNSVRFRWQEIRRDLRLALNAAAVLGAEQPGAGSAAPDPSPRTAG